MMRIMTWAAEMKGGGEGTKRGDGRKKKKEDGRIGRKMIAEGR
jgi:hypothetical protein